MIGVAEDQAIPVTKGGFGHHRGAYAYACAVAPGGG